MNIDFLISYADGIRVLSEAQRADFLTSLTASQYVSKEWLVDELNNHINKTDLKNKKEHVILVLGGWYGSFLIPLLLDAQYIRATEFHWVDKDQSLMKVLPKFHSRFKPKFNYYNVDIEKNFKALQEIPADIVINTSCEHMFDMENFWLKKPALYALQSTDADAPGHVNTIAESNELRNRSGLHDVFFGGRMKAGDKNRFMIIGQK